MGMQPHIHLDGEHAAPYALLPGDPLRVDRIAACLEDAREIAWNREYKSIRGTYRGVPVLAVSTGIGGPSAVIAVEELAAIGVKALIRVGSCGALQRTIAMGDLILPCGAVRDDGASGVYAPPGFPAVADTRLLFHLEEAARALGCRCHTGLVRSHDGFYSDREAEICARWESMGVLGADMETAALFVVARLRGLRAACVLNTVVEHEGSLEEGVNSYTRGENRAELGERLEIRCALEAVRALEGELCQSVQR